MYINYSVRVTHHYEYQAFITFTTTGYLSKQNIPTTKQRISAAHSSFSSVVIFLLLFFVLYYYYYHYYYCIFHFSALAGKYSLSLDVVINRIRLGGLICSLTSFLQLNMCQELQIFAFVYMYWGAS